MKGHFLKRNYLGPLIVVAILPSSEQRGSSGFGVAAMPLARLIAPN